MKLKKKTLSVAVVVEGETPRVKLIKLTQFTAALASSDPKHHWGLMREWFEELFGTFPDAGVHLEMLKLRIQYELLKQDYDSQKLEMPERVKQNWIASKHYMIEKLTPSLKGIMETLIRGNNKEKGEEEMSPTPNADKTVNRIAKNTVALKKEMNSKGKETVTQTYIRLFQENGVKKLKDENLATEMCKAHPDKKKYTPEDIAAVRGMYNRGKLSGQNKPPLHMCEKVEAKKSVVVSRTAVVKKMTLKKAVKK